VSITFEWLTSRIAILRLHAIAGAAYGDPYVWWTVGVLHDDSSIELKGTDRPLSRPEMRTLFGALRRIGFRRRIHERIVEGAVRRIEKAL
jgi:hypothetical protein